MISISLFLLFVGLVLKCQLCEATVLSRVKRRLLNGIVSEVSKGIAITKTWTRIDTALIKCHSIFRCGYIFVHSNSTEVPEN